MVKCICSNCKYRCDLKNPRECPYCGKNTLEREKSASELLEDINNLLEN